jgi:4-amino-4-deoxy-L-arabinose transferase-like glycosyltransferase
MSPGETLTWREVFFALAFSLPFFVNLGYSQIWGSEGRWLFISQRMLETGKWFEPKLGEMFYGDKPLLSYWAIVLAALPFGQVMEGIARLPSAVSGATTVLLTSWLGAKLFGRKTAILAACFLATTASFLLWTRTAAADAMNVAFSTASICVYLSWRIRYRSWKPLIFFLLLSIGGHVKGMPAVIVPLGVIATHMLLSFIESFLRIDRKTPIHSKLKDVLRSAAATARKQLPWILAGSLVGASLYLLPFYLAYLERGDWELLRFMYRENFVRAFQGYDHRGAVYEYVKTLPLMFLPWSLWFPGALGWAAKRFQRHQGFRFGLLCFAVIFLLFTASESRRSYYLLPIFPFAAVLVAGFFVEMLELPPALAPPGRAWRFLFTMPLRVIGSLLAVGAVILLLGPLVPGWPGKLLGTLPFATGLGAVLGAAAILFWQSWNQRSERGQVATLVIAAFLMALYFSTGGDILRQRQLTERSFAMEIRDRFPALGTPVYFGGVTGRLKYYLGRGREVDTLQELRQLVEEGKEFFIITERENLPKLKTAEWLSFREVLRAETPSLPPIVKSKPRYFLISCRKK